MSRPPALTNPVTDYTAWYRDLGKRLRDLDDGNALENSDRYPHLNSRLQRRNSLLRITSYEEFQVCCCDFVTEDDWIVDFAFIMIDCPEKFRIRYLDMVRAWSPAKHSKVLAIITDIQIQCDNLLDLFSTVATDGYVQMKSIGNCHHCGKRLQVGQDIKWITTRKKSYHIECRDKSQDGALVWMRLQSPCWPGPLIKQCSYCSCEFKIGDDAKLLSCSKHAIHRGCFEQWNKRRPPNVLWAPFMCKCLPVEGYKLCQVLCWASDRNVVYEGFG